MDSVFVQLALVLGSASLFGYIVKKTNLPLLIGYLLVGTALSALTVFNFKTSAVAALPDIGVAFVLFLIGMELDFREISSFGKEIITTGLVQITISAIAGVTLASLFGFKGLEATYVGIGLSFSSTVVVVKMLLERKDLTSLYGKLAIGITLLEDLVAILILMLLSINTSSLSFDLIGILPLINLALKALLLLLITFIFSKYVLTGVFKRVANSTELLFLTALTWCFLLISIALGLGLSVVIGAFLAGIALASSPFHYHISSKIKPLRDFFVVLFFVYLGTQVGLADALNNLPLVLIFTIYAVVAKPLIFMLLLGAFGFRKHTIFQAAISLSQVSEFSLIILLFGLRMGLISANALSVLALTVTLSIIFSSVLIAHSKLIYSKIRGVLDFFERKNKYSSVEQRLDKALEDHFVIIGSGTIGGPVVKFLRREGIPFIVLDFDPKVVESLQKDGVSAYYGDLGDPEVLENLNLAQAKLVISTASDFDDNKVLLSELKRNKSRAKVVVRVQDEDEEEELKKRHEVDYVILPERVSAEFLVNKLKTYWP